jgi:hypothetical protein
MEHASVRFIRGRQIRATTKTHPTNGNSAVADEQADVAGYFWNRAR